MLKPRPLVNSEPTVALVLPLLPVLRDEPRAGGNYLRDPVTGALSPNPAFEIPQE